MSDVERDLDAAFEPERFQRDGEALIAVLAAHLDRMRGAVPGGEGTPQVLPSIAPQDLESLVPAIEDRTNLAALLGEVLERSNKLHHPGYIGHQVATVMPGAALVEAFSALLNNGMAVYEMGQMQTVIERRVIRFLAEALGFGAGSDGVLTHGGSLGNLTALLAARQAKCHDYDVWTEGQREPMAVLVSEQAHYCVQRSVQVMGWGAGGAVGVATDDRYRMRPDALGDALARARDAGRRVIAVVASSCTTSTGSFDPIDEVADFCEHEGLWLHVDGAHGASLALSAKYRSVLKGVARADSVVWDLHKMMMLPALNTAVVFRDGQRSHEAFAQQAAYLFDDGEDAVMSNVHDVGKRTMECTKRAMGVTAYAMIRVHGADVFEAHVDRLIDLARVFSGLVVDAPDFELAIEPECNIVCFRIRPEGLGAADTLSDHQAAVRAAMLRSGEFYIVQTKLGSGGVWLRVTVMNPATTEADLSALLNSLRTCSSKLLAAADREG